MRMRMLSDSLIGIDEGSSSATAKWAWTASLVQTQLTPEGRIDAHRGLILAALLCALVGAISLHSLLRCALHYCGRRRRAQLTGRLKESALRRMLVVLYVAEAECATICLGEFADSDAVHLLPRCRHGFHVRCIDTWLSAHSSCLICQDSLLDEGATASEATTVAGEGT